MNYININQSSLSLIVLGCMRIPELDSAGLDALLGTSLDCGINVLDVADVYTNGVAEENLGAALSRGSMRDKFFLQTKCGIRKNPHYFDFSKEHILEAVEGSLRRLKTDHIDSLLLHRPDALMEPLEIAEAFEQLYQQGKVLSFGVSNHNPMMIELLKTEVSLPLWTNQLQMSVCHTPMLNHGFNVNMDNDAAINRDGSVLEYCRIHNMVIQAWSVMQHGFFRGVFIGSPTYLKLNSVLDRIAQEQNVSSTAVAIAWILRYPGIMQAVIGTTKPQRVKDSALACDVKLSRAQWYEIYLAAGNELP